MTDKIKRLFCKHRWKLLRWRWFVDVDERGGRPRIETKCECRKCLKVQCFVVPVEEQEIFVKTYPDLEV